MGSVSIYIACAAVTNVYTESPPISIPSSSRSQPIPLDANGDLRIDLLGSTLGSSELSLWSNTYNNSNSNTPLFTL